MLTLLVFTLDLVRIMLKICSESRFKEDSKSGRNLTAKRENMKTF